MRAACTEVALWILEEPDAAEHFGAEAHLMQEVIYQHACSHGELTNAAIAYLFEKRATDHVILLLRALAREHRPLLESHLFRHDAFGWESLAAAVKQCAGHEELLEFACQCLLSPEQRPSEARRHFARALCEMSKDFSGLDLHQVAECIAGLQQPELTEAFAIHLPKLNRADALHILTLQWTDWWWMAACVRAQYHRPAVVKEVCSRLTPAAVKEMSTRAVVALISVGDEVSRTAEPREDRRTSCDI